eukprot:gene10357-12249_t
MASFYWGVYANSCMLSKKRQENQEPLYLEEQQVIIRKFPKHVAYSKVCINRVVPTIFSTDGGQAELHGNFATAVHEDIFVTCNGKECTVQSHSLTRLLLMLPSGSEINRPLCVTVKEQSTPTVVSTTMRNMITYKAPMITGFKAEAIRNLAQRYLGPNAAGNQTPAAIVPQQFRIKKLKSVFKYDNLKITATHTTNIDTCGGIVTLEGEFYTAPTEKLEVYLRVDAWEACTLLRAEKSQLQR